MSQKQYSATASRFTPRIRWINSFDKTIMPKKSRRTSSGAVTSSSGAATSPPAAKPPTSAAVEPPTPPNEAVWGRVKRSLLGLLLISGFAMMDPLTLKEGVTITLPDHKPLLALVFLFGWVVWKKWVKSSKRGLHPFFRTLGFIAVLAGCLAFLPFNYTVTMLEVPLLTPDECRAVVDATVEAVYTPGFVPSFSVFDPSSEVPVQDLPDEVSAMVSAAIENRLMTFVDLEYGNQGKITLDERLYVEHHGAHLETSSPAHVRHGQLSLRVELDPPESKYVGGGGVLLESMGKVVTPGLGSGVILPSKLRHSSFQPESKERSVLVGTFTVKGRNPWQRFVCMWRMWGLFSRSVRYVADKRLSSSGMDSIPAPEPEQEGVGAVGVEGVGGRDADKLEF